MRSLVDYINEGLFGGSAHTAPNTTTPLGELEVGDTIYYYWRNPKTNKWVDEPSTIKKVKKKTAEHVEYSLKNGTGTIISMERMNVPTEYLYCDDEGGLSEWRIEVENYDKVSAIISSVPIKGLSN